MNSRIRTGLISAAIAGASVVGVSQFAGTANAQVDDGTDPVTEQVDGTNGTGQEGDGDEGDGENCGRRGNRGANSEETAELLGIDVESLRAALDAGDTLAEIAEANGVDPQSIIDARVADRAERLAAAVDDGRLTEAEAADKLADATERITTKVNEGGPERTAPPADDAEA